MSAEVIAQIQDAACRAFTALDCNGLARVDFFVTAADEVVVNEINTMPGFTHISMYPKMWAASGVDYPTLVDRLVAAALRRTVD
jgi:D-alanine-D-alanine ligase